MLTRSKTQPAAEASVAPAVPVNVAVFIALLCTVSIVLALWLADGMARARWPDYVLFTLLALLAERWDVRLSTHNRISLSFPVHLCAAVLFGPAFAGLVAATGVIVIDGFVHRRRLSRVMFNASQMALAAIICGMVFEALNGSHPVSLTTDALALIGAALAYLVVNDVLVGGIIALTGGNFMEECVSLFRDSGVPWLAMIPLAALMAFAYQDSRWTLIYFPLLVIVIYNGFRLYMSLQNETDSALVALADSIDRRDEYTFQHSQRVADLVARIAEAMGLQVREIDQLVSAARVHDLGKIATDNRVLFKKSSLTADELRIIRQHSAEGGDLAGRFSMFRAGQDIIRHHHERWDGNGYPDGLAGTKIPLGARIIAVADSYDAMTSDRPYRQALPHEIALIEIQRASGQQFDPAVVDAFVACIQEHEPAVVAAPVVQPQESCSFS